MCNTQGDGAHPGTVCQTMGGANMDTGWSAHGGSAYGGSEHGGSEHGAWCVSEKLEMVLGLTSRLPLRAEFHCCSVISLTISTVRRCVAVNETIYSMKLQRHTVDCYLSISRLFTLDPRYTT